MPRKIDQYKHIDLDVVKGAQAYKDFPAFIQLLWHAVEPGTPYQDSWYRDTITQHLLDLTLQEDHKNLLICMPPRFGKTLLTLFFIAWQWLRNPSLKILYATHSVALSQENAAKLRAILESDLFQKCYGKIFQLEQGSNTKDRFDSTSKGYFQSIGVTSKATGYGCDLLVCDDVNDAADAWSAAKRTEVHNWWSRKIATRQNLFSQTASIRIVIQQRLHPQDLIGYILESDPTGWIQLILPLEYAGDRSYNKLGWQDPRRKLGELLAPLPESWLTEQKNKLGPIGFAAQYNQCCKTTEGSLFKAEDLRTYKTAGENYLLGERVIAKSACRRICTTDMAITEGNNYSDFTVATVFDITPQTDLILVHLYRQRISGTKIVPAFKAIYQAFQPLWIGIEEAGFQKIISQMLLMEGIRVYALKAHLDKVARSIPLQVKVAAHQLWLPEPKPADLVLELCEFPNGKHDDICFIAGTLIATDKGQRPIEAIRAGDMVLTRHGYKKVLNAGQTGFSDTITVHYNSVSLTGTPNHPVWTETGWLPMKKITPHTILYSWIQSHKFTIKPTQRGKARPNTYIGTFGKTHTEQYHRDTSYTTKTEIQTTILWKTWSVCQRATIVKGTGNKATTIQMPSDNTWKQSAHLPPLGIARQKEGNGTSNMARNVGLTSRWLNQPVFTAGSSLIPTFQPLPNTVLITVAPEPGIRQASTMKPDNAPFAATIFQRTSIDTLKLVPINVRQVCANNEKQAVFNLTVDGASEYFANCILVHNCDCLAYACAAVTTWRPVGYDSPASAEDQKKKAEEEETSRFWHLIWD